jgi:hypothetical protein
MSLILNGTDGLSDVDGTAATPAIRGTDANTGIFFPAADTIAFSEDGTEVARFNSSGNLVLNNALNASSGVLATQNGMTGIAKAWCNFNGTGTVAINGSFNVSSITDNGTGDYTINFTTALPNANYSSVISASPSYGVSNPTVSLCQSGAPAEVAPTTTAFRFTTNQATNGAFFDAKYISASFFSS